MPTYPEILPFVPYFWGDIMSCQPEAVGRTIRRWLPRVCGLTDSFLPRLAGRSQCSLSPSPRCAQWHHHPWSDEFDEGC